ncbi:MAG: nuclear transport factor 2 family protein [Ferruginibacter sp.]
MIKDMLSEVTTTPKKVVLSFIDALNNEDFDAAQDLVSNDMVFNGVLGSRNGAEEYFNDMRKMKFKYEVLKAFADQNDVCLLYDIAMGDKKIFTCGWYQVEDDKIKLIRVVFDPRPVLEGGAKK